LRGHLHPRSNGLWPVTVLDNIRSGEKKGGGVPLACKG
jgi:hypothetical protein